MTGLRRGLADALRVLLDRHHRPDLFDDLSAYLATGRIGPDLARKLDTDSECVRIMEALFEAQVETIKGYDFMGLANQRVEMKRAIATLRAENEDLRRTLSERNHVMTRIASQPLDDEVIRRAVVLSYQAFEGRMPPNTYVGGLVAAVTFLVAEINRLRDKCGESVVEMGPMGEAQEAMR